MTWFCLCVLQCFSLGFQSFKNTIDLWILLLVVTNHCVMILHSRPSGPGRRRFAARFLFQLTSNPHRNPRTQNRTSNLIKHRDCADTNSITGSSPTFYHCSLVTRFCTSFSDAAALLRCIFCWNRKLDTHTQTHAARRNQLRQSAPCECARLFDNYFVSIV